MTVNRKTIRNAFVFLLILSLILMPSIPALAATEITAPQGSNSYSFSIPLEIHESAAYAGIQFALTISDESTLKFDSFELGDAVKGASEYPFLYTHGEHSFGFWTGTNAYSGMLRVGTLNFTYTGSKPVTIKIIRELVVRTDGKDVNGTEKDKADLPSITVSRASSGTGGSHGNNTPIVIGEEEPGSYAQELYKLGLFLGTGEDSDGNPTFGLEQPLTRLQALVLTVRLLGLEDDALAFDGVNPFTDVPEWGVPYAAFAYMEGITNGTSANTFTPDAYVSCTEFTAFLLRSLGYNEKLKDFEYEDTMRFALETGLYDASMRDKINHIPFLRDDAVTAMVTALLTPVKDSDTSRLIDTLSDAGVITQVQTEDFVKAIDQIDAA